MRQVLRLTVSLLLTALSVSAQPPADREYAACPSAKIGIQKLPDLNIARAGHQLFCTNGEIIVAGGHTKGFVPTPTAEYLKEGKWHMLEMVYNHDFGFSATLSDGKVLLGGGCSEPIGIGQTFLAESYDQLSHTFNAFSSMECKRTLASALELGSGQVVIAGNWYHDDGIESFDGKKHFTYLKKPTVGRSTPFILRIAKDDAIIVGNNSIRGDSLYCTYAERLKGDTVHIPLLKTWQPVRCTTHRDAESFIGNEQKQEYSYLLPMVDKTGQVAIAQVNNGSFSLLPTVSPIPMCSQGIEIEYSYPVIVDRQARRAYLTGIDHAVHSQPEQPHRLFIVAIDYEEATAKRPAALTLYHTDPIMTVPDYAPVLDDNGNLIIAGGLQNGSNFTPSSEVWLLQTGTTPHMEGTQAISRWWWMVATPVLFAIALCFIHFRHRLRHCLKVTPSEPETIKDEVLPTSDDRQLMERIRLLIEQEQLYLDSNLKISDIAKTFHLHRNDISACINSQMGCTFTQYINHYRIEYAKQLMRQKPDKKISSVWMESGFGSEQTFFKTFRTTTGLSPKEWIAQQDME